MRKLLIYFALLVLPFVSSASEGIVPPEPQKRLTVEMKDKTTKEVLDHIEKNSDYIFFYGGGIDTKRIVSVSVHDDSITSILDRLFKGTNVKYEVNDRQITLKQVTDAKAQSAKQERSLIGTVLDANTGEPVIGAVVFVKENNTNSSVTDLDGRFSMNIKSNSTLVFSCLGYAEEEMYITDQGEVTVKMNIENDVLNEVVVVGAGTQKKVSVTGSISAVKGMELKTPASSLTSNLAGKLSGVIAVASSGEPGSTSEFYIRGVSTFGGRTAPLILLDGVEISAGDLNNLPTESIETFSILKDASATAIYGARGANGVMLITTKSGSENTKAKISITVDQSFLQPVNMVKMADGATYMKTYNEAQLGRDPMAIAKYSDMQIEHTASKVNPYLYPDVDWYELMFKKFTMNQRANINVTGGGSKVTYYMSLQMNHDGGILDVPKKYSFNNNYNRYLYTFQNNIGYMLTPSTKLDLRMNAQISSTQSPDQSSDNIFQTIFMNTPVSFPAYFPEQEGDGHIRFGTSIMSAGRFYTNPYANMLNTYRKTNSNKLNISLNLDQKLDFITEGLSVTALVNFNNYSEKYYTRSLSPFLYGIESGSWSEEDPSQYSITELKRGEEFISQSSGVSRYSDNTFYLDARINYNRRFGKHTATGMLMYMMREFSSSILPNRNQGFSGRFTYDYDNRYLAEFNFGYNGTERIAKGDRFEFFPAMSLGWVISNEPFWEPIKAAVDYFKLRGSYGLVGSDETGTAAAHFLYLNSINMSGGNWFATGYKGGLSYQGSNVNSYAVADAHWERSRQLDLGLDMRLFNQVNVVFDYYHNKRDRILMRRASFPSILGYAGATPWSNVGEVDNRGFELSVNWAKQLTKDLFIDVRANYTYSKNKYVYVDEPDYPYVWKTDTGKPLGHMTGYIADGLFKDQADIDASADQSLFGSVVMPGDIKYRDVDGDGRITADDQVMLSPYGRLPRIQYGIGVSVTWKKFDVSVFFNGSAKRKIMLTDQGAGIYPFCANDSNDHNLMQWIADGHWSEGKDNSNVVYPRLGILDTQISNNQQPSSFWMKDAGFLRFKTLEIGYSFPYCRVYLSADNLFVWSPFKYWDPELNSNSYPMSRMVNIGVQVKL